MKTRWSQYLWRALGTIAIGISTASAGLAQESETPTPQWRPLYHYSPPKNWINDPNGLIYLNGVYHLYTQHNPFENKWGHMSWGHATSPDLVHWTELPVAMPETIDKDTTWRFSGCAVEDKNNSSGLCTGQPCLVAVYTAHQPNLKKESQYIAVSNDQGRTFTNYSGNPVIDLGLRDFRDPNVHWNQTTKQWTMVVAIPAEHAVRFYGSADLKSWKLLSTFGNAGYDKGHWECPSLAQLTINGKRKWVLFVSAANRETAGYMQYFIGDFDGTTFHNDNPASKVLTVDGGDAFYAAISWNNLPAGQNVFLGWMMPGPQPTNPWRGQMSLPRELSLLQTAEGVRLAQQPAPAFLKTLATSTGASWKKSGMKAGNTPVAIGDAASLDKNAYRLQCTMTIAGDKPVMFRLAAPAADQGGTLVGYDPVKKELFVDRSANPAGSIKPGRERVTSPLSANGKLTLDIFIDRSSLEVFANRGEAVISAFVFPAEGETAASVVSEGSANIQEISIRNLAGAGPAVKSE